MKRLLLTAFFTILVFLSFSQIGPKLSFQKCLGGSRNDYINDVLPLPNGDFIIAGESYSNDGDVSGHHGSLDSSDAWVARITNAGNIIWQLSVGGTNNDKFNSIIRGKGDTIYCVGSTISVNGDIVNAKGNIDAWVVSITTAGMIISSRNYGGTGGEEFKDGVYTASGLVLIGQTSSNDGDVNGNSGGSSDAWVVKTGFNGQIIWSKCYGGQWRDFASDIIESNDGTLYADTHQQLPAFSDEYMLKLDPSNGNVLKNELLFARFSDFGTLINNNGNIIRSVASLSAYPSCANEIGQIGNISGNAGTAVITPFKCSNPEMLYSSYFARSHGIDAVNPNTVVGVGTMQDQGIGPTKGTKGATDAFVGLLRLTSYNFINYGGSGVDMFNSVKTLPGGGNFIAVGYSNSNDKDVSGNHGGYDGWMTLLESTNLITGAVFIDYNGNDLRDINEPEFSQANISTTGNNGFNASTIPVGGNFYQDVDTGTYTTTIKVNNAYYTPKKVNTTTAFLNYRNTATVNFPILPIPGKRDYSLTSYALTQARPGFENLINLSCTNVGTDTLLNREIRLVKSSKTSFISASPAPSSIQGDTLRWVIPTLTPFAKQNITLTLKTATIPTVSLFETLTYQYSIDSTGDLNLANNGSTLRQVVTGSFDPNDKLETHGRNIFINELQQGEALHYTIRFQNTGNDTAFNISIRDTLSTLLEPESVWMQASSHPYKLQFEKGNIMVWTFTNIKLVDSLTDPVKSQGFVSFSVKPKNNVKIGDTIMNKAAIYFDFNPPVFTNMLASYVLPSAPQVPAFTGLNNTYCGKQATASVKITNLPQANSGTFAIARINNQPVTITADSTVSIPIAQLSPGQQNFTVTYSNVTDTKASSSAFTVVKVDSPNVVLSSSITEITDLNVPVLLTATNLTGGGTAPSYTFARDRDLSNILQAASSANTYSLNPSTLQVGTNWLYVKMNTSSTCAAFTSDLDSIRLERSVITGITDPDNPGSPISIHPNPFHDQLLLKGLMPMKQYVLTLASTQGQVVIKQVINGSTENRIKVQELANGPYILQLFERKGNKLLGSLVLIKQ